MSSKDSQVRMFHAGFAERRADLEMLQLVIVLDGVADAGSIIDRWRAVADRRIERAREEMRGLLPVGAWSGAATLHSVEASGYEEVSAADAALGIDPTRSPHRFTYSVTSEGHTVIVWTIHHSHIDMTGIVEVLLETFWYEHPPLAHRHSSAPPINDVEHAAFWADIVPLAQRTVSSRGTLLRARRRVERSIGERVQHSTPFLFACTMLAAELSGDEHVSVGNVYDARRYQDMRGLCVSGPAISVAPVTVRWDGSAVVDEVMQAARAADLRARQIVAAERSDQPSSGWPITLNFQPLDWRGHLRAALAALGLTLVHVDLVQHTSLPIVMHIEHDSGWTVELTSWSGYVTAEALECLADRSVAYLRAAIDTPSAPVAALLRSPVLRGQTTSPETDLPRLLDHVLREYRNAEAVIDKSGSCTYEHLDRRSRAYATTLARRGLIRGDRVGVHASPSIEFYAAVLGLIRSGITYVPLDPNYPPSRLEHIASDAGLSCIITERPEETIFDVPAMHLGSVSDAKLLAVSSGGNPDDIAYIIYTSGSTGAPKGVAVTGASLANLVFAQRAAFGVSTDDRVLQYASASFDASISEIFVTLGAGAALVVCEPDRRVGSALQHLLVERQVTMVTLPPTIAALLEPESLSSLRTIISAGEACPDWFADRWGTEGRIVINAYGPTEATVCATTARIKPGDPMTIGRPIANVGVAVVDEDMTRVGRGKIGEIVITGRGVAAGYLHANHDSKFCEIDLDGQAEAAYRTGDLGSLDPANRLQFHGRRDDQVKRNGVRIELGDIESTLQTHPLVLQAVASVPSGMNELRAYVVASRRVDQAELRAFVQSRLPAGLLPTRLIQIDLVPLTPSGKIDRSALDAMAVLTAAEAETRPATDLEHQLAGIWEDVLGVDEVGLYDNFFDLGGTSLQAALILSKAAEMGDFDSPLFAQTVAAQAESQRSRTEQGPPAVRRRPRARSTP